MSVIHQAQAQRDRYAALLRDSLGVLSQETTTTILTNLEADLHNNDLEPAERLEANAMLVGFLTVMCEGIEAAQENKP